MVKRPVEVGCEGAGIQGRGSDLQVRGWLPARLELPAPALAKGDRDLCGWGGLRRRKLVIRCGFCARGECKFEGCCARSLRIAAAAKDPADSDYEASSADSEGGTLGWPVTEAAVRTMGGGRRAVVVGQASVIIGAVMMAAATEAGSLRSGSRTRDTRRRLSEVQDCWLTGLTSAPVEATQDARAKNRQ